MLNRHAFALSIVALALTACGKGPSPAPDGSSAAPAAAQSSAALPESGTGNNYQTASVVKAFGSNEEIPAGTQVTVLETRGEFAHLGIDSDDERLPTEAWVKLADAKLEKLGESDLEESDGILEDAGRRVSGGMTYCYRYVKEYLLSHHLVKSYLPGASAWMASGVLQRMGWHQISGGPDAARVNDVCVYRGGRGDNGHAEVRVPGGWYYGYGVKPHSIGRANHPFIGCYRK